MSDVIKINIKGNKKLKAVLPRDDGNNNNVLEIDDEETLEKKFRKEYERGFNDGYRQGSEETEAKYEELLIRKNEEFYGILKEFENKIEEYEQTFSEVVIRLAGIIAKKILKKETESESIIEQTIGDALSQVIAAQKIAIRVNPDDLHLIEKAGATESDLRFSKIRFEADPTIEKGGCIVETEIGNVDARISSQLDEILRQLELNFVKSENDDAG